MESAMQLNQILHLSLQCFQWITFTMGVNKTLLVLHKNIFVDGT